MDFVSSILILLGLGFLVANVKLAYDYVLFLRRRRGALLTWRAPKPPQYTFGLALGVALGLLVLYAAWAIPDSPLYAQVGAKAVPYLVGAILVALGIGLSASAGRGGWSHGLEEAMAAPPTNWRALGLLGAGLLVVVHYDLRRLPRAA